jgi:hypothetical protein
VSTLDKLVTGITQTIKMNDRIESVSAKIDALLVRLKDIEVDVRNIDKRLVRIETFAEIAQKQKLLK